MRRLFKLFHTAPWIATLLLFVLPAAALVFARFDNSTAAYAAYDQIVYHLPAIERFAREWPRFDLTDYSSATTPGYHLLFAAVSRAFSGDIVAMRLVNLALTCGLLVTLGVAVSRRVRPSLAATLPAPFFFSVFVFAAGVWLVTDNLAWWGVLALLLIALHPEPGRASYVSAGILLAAVVLVRQIHLWAAAPVAVSFWLADSASTAGPRAAAKRALRILLVCLPAVLLCAGFFMLWNGVVPPSQTRISGVTRSALAFTLVLFGIFGPFYLTLIFARPSLRELLGASTARWLIALGALVGLVSAFVGPTTYDASLRGSAFWNLARFGPSIGEHSLVMAGLAAVGGAIVASVLILLNRHERVVIVITLAAFVAATSANRAMYQRYYEPFVLLILSLAFHRAIARASPDASFGRANLVAIAGPVALGLIQAVITAWRIATPL